MTEALIHYKLASETNPTNVLRFNLTDRKTLQSYKLNYFITKRVIFLIRNDSEQSSTVAVSQGIDF